MIKQKKYEDMSKTVRYVNPMRKVVTRFFLSQVDLK